MYDEITHIDESNILAYIQNVFTLRRYMYVVSSQPFGLLRSCGD